MIISSHKHINRLSPVWQVLLLCVANLLVMHYFILFTCHIESNNFIIFISNALSTLFDIGCLFLFFFIVTGKRLKSTLCFCFVVTLVWSLSNVIYSRFFNQYLNISAIGQSDMLLNGWIVRCVISDLHWFYLYYLFIFIIGCRLLSKFFQISLLPHLIRNLFFALISYLFIYLLAYACYSYVKHPNHFADYFKNILEYRITRTPASPIYSHFLRGEIRSLCVDALLNSRGKIELSAGQKKVIDEIVEKSRMGISDSGAFINPDNIIFIIVESYLSVLSDKKIEGREITPYLNSLKRDSSCYYNGRMRENITMGKSSDGQLIYMTGLLPLRSMVTVSKASKLNLPSLAKALGRHSRMIIPTLRTVWEQDAMCRSYGFDKLYSSVDYGNGSYDLLNDEQLFLMASQLDSTERDPFFSVILTMSMHEPYIEWKDTTFMINAPLRQKEEAYYLNACHYTDKQIGNYIEQLKNNGLYEKSLIVITSDHALHNSFFRGEYTDLPLYIIYSGLPQMWSAECNQVDVYPTLLDLLGINPKWCGFGKSLLSPVYKSKLDSEKWDISEWMLLSDYFMN